MKIDIKQAQNCIPAQHDAYKSQRMVMEEFERTEEPPVLLIAPPSKLNASRTVQIQVPVLATTPVADWNPANTIKKNFPVLTMDGSAEDCLSTCLHADTICQQHNRGNDFGYFIGMLHHICDANVAERYNEILGGLEVDNQMLAAADRRTAEELKRSAWNELGKDFFSDHQNIYRKQKRHMQKLAFPKGKQAKEVINRIVHMNRLFPYFPYDEEVNPNGYTEMPQDELVDCVDGIAKPHWKSQMKRDNKTADSFSTLAEMKAYFTRLEESDKLDGISYDSPVGKKPALKKNTGKRKQPEGNQPSGKAKKPSGKGKACKHCNKKGHPESKCWELEENAASRPPQWKSVKSGEQTETTNVVENQCPVEKAGHLRGSRP